MNLWHITEETFEPTLKRIHSNETVFTIGNGYFGTRGTYEEGYPRDNAATLLFGVFDDIPVAREELANTPDWIPIKLFVNRERFRLDRGQILAYQRSLDMQQGLLRRTVTWRSDQGIRLRLDTERFASLADEHVGAIRYTVTIEETPDNQPCDISIWSGISLAEGNYDVMHWESVDQRSEGDISWFHTETKKTLVQLVQSMCFLSDTPEFERMMLDSDIAPSIRYNGKLAPGETFTADKIVVMYTSRDVHNPREKSIAHLQKLLDSASGHYRQVYNELLARNQEAWRTFWEVADVVIEGDERAQRGMRFNIYQLRINVSDHDYRYSVAAKGLTGFGYRGHVFHDTEVFMLPFYTFVMPKVARNLLLYRYHLLDAARRKAASNGYEGAQYPWESTLNGEETTPVSIVHPETGEVVPVLNGFIELHITASIAYAVWQYWQITGDDAFLRDYGAEILLSTATFWASRVEKNEETNQYEINDVIGPDEWHEHVDNNAFTNYMASKNILYALDALRWLALNAPEKERELGEKLRLTNQRISYWLDVAQHMRVPQVRQSGLFEQFDGFFQLEPLDQSKFKGRRDSFQGILGVEAVQKYRIIKQADVLMLLTLQRDQFDERTKRVNWDYYYPITDHDYGSSLTPALHVVLACELAYLEEAYKLFMKGAMVDIENLRGNTPEGIHAACAGAVWQAAIFGAAGLQISDEHKVITEPHWLNNWSRLAFSVYYKGKLHRFDLRREQQ